LLFDGDDGDDASDESDSDDGQILIKRASIGKSVVGGSGSSVRKARTIPIHSPNEALINATPRLTTNKSTSRLGFSQKEGI
jgi:hypothetical protein